MKKIISASLTAALLGSGLVLATALPASAATVPAEFCAPVYETQPNPDYIPEVPEVSHVETVVITPEVPEVSHTEYLYKQHVTGKEKWRDSLTWNPGIGWYYAGETRTVIDVPYQPAVTEEVVVIDVPYQPAVGEPTIQVQTGEHCEVWVTWETTFLVDNPKNDQDVTWPQSFIGFGKIAPVCDQQVQQDRYVGSREAIDAILADDILTGNPPEDSGVVKEWLLVDGGKCAPAPLDPDVVVTYGEFGGAEPTCETPEVTWTRERTTVTTPYIVVGDPHSGWSQVLDVENAVTVTETDEETLVVEHDGDCELTPVEEPEEPVEEPEEPVSETAPPSDKLAYTGASGDSGLFTALALSLLVVGGGFVAFAARRKQHQ